MVSCPKAFTILATTLSASVTFAAGFTNNWAVEIFPGFSASDTIAEDDQAKGIITGDMGAALDGSEKYDCVPGMELRTKYTLCTEGYLGKRLINDSKLDESKDPTTLLLRYQRVVVY